MTDISGQKRGEDWWSTNIIKMSPGHIAYHGHPVESLVGNISFPAMIWLMLRGELPTQGQADLLGAALVASVDHGPQAPSIAIARMSITCGIGINNAMASAINALGDVHGGAGEQALDLFASVACRMDAGASVEAAVAEELQARFPDGRGYVPGLGHRFHPVDPRTEPLLALVEQARNRGDVSGRFAAIAREIEAAVHRRKGKLVPLNIDGATAVIYGELGFPPPLCRGLFVLARSVGILSHAWEQSQQPARNKGPLPREWTWTYTGKDLPDTEHHANRGEL